MRRAARRAFLWPEQAFTLYWEKESLTELSGIGPYLNKLIVQWLRKPPEEIPEPPPIRRGFLTLADVPAIRARHPALFKAVRGDLQMHTVWSDGTASVQEMADAAAIRGYFYIAITDHANGLKIAGGIDENHWRARQRKSRGSTG